jgi:hypothetical protein
VYFSVKGFFFLNREFRLLVPRLWGEKPAAAAPYASVQITLLFVPFVSIPGTWS